MRVIFTEISYDNVPYITSLAALLLADYDVDTKI